MRAPAVPDTQAASRATRVLGGLKLAGLCEGPSRYFLPRGRRPHFRACLCRWEQEASGQRGASPAVHEVGDDGGQHAQQHDRRAGVHHRVQELPWVLGQREHSLQILEGTQSGRMRDMAERLRAAEWGRLPETPPCPCESFRTISESRGLPGLSKADSLGG